MDTMNYTVIPPVKINTNRIDAYDEAKLGTFDYVILAALLIVSMAIGAYYAWKDRKEQGTEGFLMGNRSMTVFPTSLSLMASFISSTLILGIPLDIYFRGTQTYAAIIACIVASTVAAEIFVPVFYKLKMNSANQYLLERYKSDLVRSVASFSAIFSFLPSMAVVMYGPSIALSSVTALTQNEAIVLMGIVCTAYTAVGGLKAVIWTDCIQYLVIIFAIFVIVIKGTLDVGSVTEVFKIAGEGNRLHMWNFEWDIYGNNFWNAVIGFCTMFTASYGVSQMQIQRTCSMPTLRAAKAVIYISMPGFIAIVSIVVYFGLVIFANYSHCDPVVAGRMNRVDELVPYYVTQKMSKSIAGLPGLLVASIFAASLSTLSSGFNGIAALVWEDFLKHRLAKTRSIEYSHIIIKVISGFIGLFCMCLAFVVGEIGNIFEAATILAGAAVGPIFGIFVIGMFTSFGNALGATVGLVSGQAICSWIVVGMMINKKPMGIGAFYTSTEDCPAEWNITQPIPFSFLKDNQFPKYQPQGLNQLYHMSQFLVPVVGLITSLVLGIIVSILSGGNKGNPVEERFRFRFRRSKGIKITDSTKL